MGAVVTLPPRPPSLDELVERYHELDTGNVVKLIRAELPSATIPQIAAACRRVAAAQHAEADALEAYARGR